MVLMVASIIILIIMVIDIRDTKDIEGIMDIKAIVMDSLFIMGPIAISIVVIIDIMDKHMGSKQVIMDSKLRLVVIRVFIKGAIDM